jgi:hypothetical protein
MIWHVDLQTNFECYNYFSKDFFKFCVFDIYIFRCIGFCFSRVNYVDVCFTFLVNFSGLVFSPEEVSSFHSKRSLLF